MSLSSEDTYYSCSDVVFGPDRPGALTAPAGTAGPPPAPDRPAAVQPVASVTPAPVPAMAAGAAVVLIGVLVGVLILLRTRRRRRN